MKHIRWSLAILITLVVPLVAACGPGVGGTGTGDGNVPGAAGLAWFGAQPADVCQGPLAMPLGCASPAPGTPQVPGIALQLVGACAAATLDGDGIVLDVICGGLEFAGRWGQGADGMLRYYGLISLDPSTSTGEPATLDVVVEDGRVIVWLRDLGGALLAGPLALEPARAGTM